MSRRWLDSDDRQVPASLVKPDDNAQLRCVPPPRFHPAAAPQQPAGPEAQDLAETIKWLKATTDRIAEYLAAITDQLAEIQAAIDAIADTNRAEKPNGDPFPSPEVAITWALKQGAFNARPHAINAYNKVKRQHEPQNAREMATYWRADVQRRIKGQSEASH